MGYTPSHLGHVNIFVRNVEKSYAWYKDILGLHTYDYTPGRAAFMSANLDESHEIAIVEVGEDAAGPLQQQVGLNHMAWRMDNLEDLKEFYHRLKDKGVEFDRVGDHGISVGLYFHDPDGNGIEVYYELPRSEWYTQEKLFMNENRPHRAIPGPWDEILDKQEAAAVR